MENALIIGHTGGIGQAVFERCSAQGMRVTGLSRSSHGLDIRDESSVQKHVGGLDGSFDLIFVATGALASPGKTPEKSLAQLDVAELTQQYLLNAVGPALVLKYTKQSLPRHKACVFAALSARVGSIGDNHLGGWYGYRASKAALNQFIRSAAIEMRRTHKDLVCVALHPGTVATDLTHGYAARHKTVTPDVAAERLLSVIESLTADQTGSFLDYSGAPIAW